MGAPHLNDMFFTSRLKEITALESFNNNAIGHVFTLLCHSDHHPFFGGGLIDNDNYGFMVRAIVQGQTQFLPSSLRTENTKWTIASTSTQANGTTRCAHFLITRTQI